MSTTESHALADRLGILGTLDRAIFSLETVTVVTALVVMSISVFTDVVYQLMVTIQQNLTNAPGEAWTLSAVLLAFVGAMAWASTATMGSVGKRAGITLVTVVAISVFAWMLTHVESSTVYRALLIGLSAPVVAVMWRQGRKGAVLAYGVAALLAFVVFGDLPTGYSWSQSYSLLLLLWVGFLGASMAARQRRHLKIDLARKLLSPAKVPAFNALSYLAAAAFSGVVCYLSYIYIFGADSTYFMPIWEAPKWLPSGLQEELTSGFPLPPDASFFRRFLQVVFAPGEPGEVPDWLKVMAIPVSFFLITVRFLGHSIVFARMAANKEEFVEDMESH